MAEVTRSPQVDGPSNATARVGGAASFTVGVGGSAVPPFIYEWYHEAPNSGPVPLPWCTTARCEVTADARASDAGKYFVVVRGTEGMAARSGNGNLVVDGGRTAQMLQQLEERAASGGALPVVAALLVGAAGGLLLGCCCCRRRKPKARYESVSMAVE